MTSLKLIIAGLGPRGKYWMEVVRRAPDCEAVAYCDPNEGARASAQTHEPNIPTFTSLAEALKAVMADAVILATPPDTREADIALACEHRLSLLVEKPLALNIPEAARYVKMAKEAQIPLMVGLNFRYLGVTQRTLQLLAAGRLGRPEHARFTYERWRDGRLARLNKYPLSTSHPMLWEQSIHHFDLMRFVYSAEPVSVYCRTWNPSWSMYQSDTNVAAIFTFDNGVTVNYQGTWQGNWVTPHFEWRTDCTHGVILQGDQFGELSSALRDEPEATSEALPEHEVWVSDTQGVLAAFSRHLSGQGPLECSGRDHLHSLLMVEACIRSSNTGQAVAFAPLVEEVIMA
jgi:predicted dehydrogenase